MTLPPLDQASPGMSQLYTTGALTVGLPGDYNHDGTVDAADYVVWRKTGASTVRPGTTHGGPHFGEPAGSGSGAIANTTVPEPATLVLLMFAAAGWCLPARPGRIESSNKSSTREHSPTTHR